MIWDGTSIFTTQPNVMVDVPKIILADLESIKTGGGSAGGFRMAAIVNAVLKQRDEIIEETQDDSEANG